MRRDLSFGLQAANLVHAAGESSPGNLPHGTYAVALTARDEFELRALAERLVEAGVAHALIVESDAEHAGQLMAIGIAPAQRDGLRRFTSSFPLLRGGVTPT